MAGLVALPTTTVSIFVDSLDDFGAGTLNDVPAASAVSASIIEQPPRSVSRPGSAKGYVVRAITGRVPSGTPISKESRVVDETNGRQYSISDIRQPQNPAWVGDIILQLERNDSDAL